MAVLTRSQRVFSAVFAPEESPFLSGPERAEPARPNEQQAWDTLVRILEPNLGTEVRDLTGGSIVFCLD